MKAKHVSRKTSGKVKGGAAKGYSKAGLQKCVRASGKADQQMAEFERTFTLKHEW